MKTNKQDMRELCPMLSDSSIEGALRKLVAAGELKKEGKGKNTCYFRLNSAVTFIIPFSMNFIPKCLNKYPRGIVQVIREGNAGNAP